MLMQAVAIWLSAVSGCDRRGLIGWGPFRDHGRMGVFASSLIDG